MNPTSLEVSTREGGRILLRREQVEGLASSVAGPLLLPSDTGWEEAVHTWNGMITQRPALVVQPLGPTDVAQVVAFARDQGLLLSVKGGGHNIAGTALAEGGVTLDMSRMSRVSVDHAARVAHVGPGCRLRDVDRATQALGLATPLGFVSKTGVAGLTLGGGFGYLTRRFGWTADNLEQVEIVTADGRVRIADRASEPELFWAVRGGGGNFGVVTRFTFRLHDVGPRVTGGLAVWDVAHADDVLAAYRALTDAAPRELTAVLMVRLAPPAPFVPERWRLKPVVAVLVCHTGLNAAADLAPLRALVPPIFDGIGETTYAALQSSLDEMQPDGLSQYWKTEYLPRADQAYLETFRDAALEVASPFSFSVVFHIGGALNERANDDGAVGNRDARFISGFSGAWGPTEPGDAIVASVRRGWQRIRSFSTGGNYVNFQLADDDSARTAAAYGDNYERLRRVKDAYDPGNVFRLNRNVTPAARAEQSSDP